MGSSEHIVSENQEKVMIKSMAGGEQKRHIILAVLLSLGRIQSQMERRPGRQ